MTSALLAVLLTSAFAAEPEVPVSTPVAAAPVAPESLMPPAPPQRDGKPIETATALSTDLQKTMVFLEEGRAYYKRYTSSGGSHTKDENKAFLRFLEEYERELGHAKKELAVLKAWFDKSADLSQ